MMSPKIEVDQSASLDGAQVGDWQLYPSLHELRRRGEVIRLEPKAAALLVRLVQRAGRMVSRKDLLASVWPDVVVGDDSLTQAVIKLRKVLGDSSKSPRYIQTVPKQGYRLIATVRVPTGTLDTERRWSPVESARRPRRMGTLLLVGGLALVVTALGFLTRIESRQAGVDAGYVSSAAATRSTQTPLTIAVLPFKSLRQGADQDNLARGITADLVTDLSRLPSLWVISSQSVFGHDQNGGTTVALTARYNVVGSVRRTANRLEAHVRLIESSTGRQLWSERFERPIGDLFDVQSEISRRVVKTLAIKLSQAEHSRLAQRYTRNIEAYELFLRGQGNLLVRQELENVNARRMYRGAIALDPSFARAYAGLALTYVADYRNQWAKDGTAALARASVIARTSLEIDPQIPEVYWVLGYIEAQRRHHKLAIGYLERALKLDPSFADAYALMGGINTYMGHPDRSIKLLRKAIRHNPAAGYLYFLLLGRAYFFVGDPEQAMINLREALSRNPANLEAHIYMAAVAVAMDDRATGEWELNEISMLQPDVVLKDWLATYPMTDAHQVEQLTAALTSAGL